MDRIKKITVLKVKMEGFKRFKEPYEVNMNKLTYIAGANGEGKTTLADAVSYAFCGTPFWGEGSCDRLKNPDSGKMSVEVCFADENGEVHNLSRTKNGETTAVVLDGHTMRQADMAETFAEKNIFLSILNPLYFIEKLAGDGKDFLQKLMPPIPKKQILDRLSDTAKVLLETEEFAEPEVSIKDKRKEIRELGESALHIEGQIDALKKEFSEAEKNIDAVIKEFEKLVNRKNELEEKQPKGSAVEKADATPKDELYQKLAEAKARTYQSKYADEITKAKAELDLLVRKYKEYQKQAVNIQVGKTCPTCHTLITESNFSGIAAVFKKDVNAVMAAGHNAREAVQKLLELDSKSREVFEKYKADDIKKLQAEIDSINAREKAEDRGSLSEEEYAELSELKKQVEIYSAKVDAMCNTEKEMQKIEGLEKQRDEIAEKIQTLEKVVAALGEFAAKRAEMVLSKLKMKHAAIRLFDVVKSTGEIKDAFRFTYDGKDYRWISNSEKVRAGLEVSRLLQSLTGLCYPTYIDNAESITGSIDAMPNQVMLAFAKRTQLTVQSSSGQERKEAA